MQQPHVVTMTRPHTEVLPYVSIRIPCLSPPALDPEWDDHHRASAASAASSPSSAVAAAAARSSPFATRPRLLPAPVLLLLLLFFAGLTALAVGSDGVLSLVDRALLEPLPPPGAATPTLLPSAAKHPHLSKEELRQLQREAVLEARKAEARTERKKQRLRSGSSLLSFIPLVPLPPVNAVPFEWLLRHEYLSMAVWLVRTFFCRTLWHALVWWHALCGLLTMGEILRWKWTHRRKRRPAAATTDAADPSVAAAPARLPSPPVFALHALFWITQSLLFGWPSIYLLRQQLHAKSKRT